MPATQTNVNWNSAKDRLLAQFPENVYSINTRYQLACFRFTQDFRATNLLVYNFVYQQTEFSTSMAMYPNATRGYMPFVATNKRAHGQNVAKKAVKGEKHASASSKQGETKTYRVTLKDRNGFIYTYIIQADGSKSLPVLCESKVTGPNGFSSSLPNIAEAALTGRRLSLPTTSTSEKDDGPKKGLFNTLLQYIRKKTKSPSSGSSKSGKSKRKTKTMVHRKRQRTVSAMSNLDPIQESPEEDSEDADSYTHSTGSDADSFGDNEP